MEIQEIRMLLMDYQRLMIETKTKGDMELHRVCVALTRELTKQIKEKTGCSQQSAKNKNDLVYFNGLEVAMQDIKSQIKTLEKEVTDLLALHNEAQREYSRFDDEAAHFKKKAEEAEKRMLNYWDEIEHRLAKITDLEDELNGQVSGAAATESA